MIAVYDVALVPLIVGVIQLLKQLGLPNRWCPLTAALLGIAIGVIYVHPHDVVAGILVGLALGLSACGLYSGAKHAREDFKRSKICADDKK